MVIYVNFNYMNNGWQGNIGIYQKFVAFKNHTFDHVRSTRLKCALEKAKLFYPRVCLIFCLEVNIKIIKE